MAMAAEGGEKQHLTKDEVERLSNAFKDPEFRELLSEYAHEISDPKNRQLYEEEIRQLEQERGVNVTFIHPEPCYVLKTSIDGEKKAFINICSNANIREPSCQRAPSGYHWQLPYSLAPPREDLDKKKQCCQVYDIVFHPNTLYMGVKNSRFKKMMEETAINAVEHNFKVTLDKNNIRFPKMKFKGFPTSTVIREVSSGGLKEPPSLSEKFCVPYPELKGEAFKNAYVSSYDNNEFGSKADKVLRSANGIDKEDSPKIMQPKHIIKYRKHFDMGDYAYAVGNTITDYDVPQELVIEIELPKISSAASINLDVLEKSLTLTTVEPVKYKLDLTLPFEVISDAAKAKFDVTTRMLTVTLNVKKSSAKAAFELDINKDSAENEVETNLNIPDRTELDTQCDSFAANGGVVTKLSKTLPEDTNLCQSDEINISQDIDAQKNKTMIMYHVPPYDVRQSVDRVILLVYVHNVEAQSLVKKFDDDCTCVSVSFVTIGAGFVPFHYKLVIRAPQDKLFDKTFFMFDSADKNVVLSIGKDDKSQGDWQNLHLGTDEMNLTQLTFDTMVTLSAKMAEMKAMTAAMEEDEITSFNDNVFVTNLTAELLELHIGNHCNMTVNSAGESLLVKSNDTTQSSIVDLKDTENDKTKEQNTISKEEGYRKLTLGQRTKSASICIPDSSRKPKITKIRSISESGEDWSQSSIHKPRGILKFRKFNRSISESSDDFSLSPQELVSSPDNDIPEENSNDGGNYVKKSVRFNEIVCRSLFRSNSSILGQRKKNQRKQRARKKAVQRRLSESEGSEGETDITQLEDSKLNLNQAASNSNIQDNMNQIDVDQTEEINSVDNLCTDISHVSIVDKKQCLNANDVDNNTVEDLNFSEADVKKSNDVNSERNFTLNERQTTSDDGILNNADTDHASSCKSAGKLEQKTKWKKKRKFKHTSKCNTSKAVLSWEDSKADAENHDSRMSFSNALIFELDT